MKLFISQPMKGKTDEEILAVRNSMIAKVKEVHGDIEVIDSFFQGEPVVDKPLWYLGKSLELLATADIAIFAPRWDSARGCRIEHQCCLDYGIEIF